MNDFLKYYWLEQKYLEKEVYKNFHGRNPNSLTAAEFFAIVKWKRAGNTELIRRIFLADKPAQTIEKDWLDKKVEGITEGISNRKDNKERLRFLSGQAGIKLAMASSILTILYPKDFTVYDWRVRSQLKEHPDNGGKEYPDITYSSRVNERYFDEYIQQVQDVGRRISKNKRLSLRDCDRLLWAKSWYEDLQKFLARNDD